MLKTGSLSPDSWRSASKIFALLAFVLGLMGVTGWLLIYLGQQPNVFSGAAMQASTALGIIFIGICLACLHYERKQMARWGVFFILAFSLLTLTDHIWDLHLGIASWFFSNKNNPESESLPDRLLVLRAAIFFLLTAAMLLLTFKRYTVGQLLAGIIFLTSYAALIDNFYSISGFSGQENFMFISSQAALAFLLLSLALLLYCPTKGWMKLMGSVYTGGMLARYTFTYFLFVSPVLIGFYQHSLSRWQFSPGLAILSLFLLTCLITLPVIFYYLQRLNKLDAQLKRAHNNLQTTNADLSGRNSALANALADVRKTNRELAVMTKEALLSSQALELKNKELLRLNQSLDYIVQMASHDLKNPIFNLELLVRELKPSVQPHLTPEDEPLLGMVENSVTSLKKTIEGLARIIRSQQIIIGLQVSVSLSKLLQELQTELAREIKETGAQLHLQLAVDTLVFSRLHLHSVLQNLLTNALKYRSPDRAPEIKISTRAVPGGVEIIFSDNGLGMSEYQVNHLFSLFQRFHGHVEGSGIGLYLVKLTIENNGGTIKAESTEGVGTRFTIFLPQQQT